MLLCLSEAKKGSWSKCREGTESTVKEVMGAHMRRRTTCSVRPSICLKLLSLTDCINKERENKRGLSVYIAQLPRCWYTNKPLSSFFLKVYNFPAACSWCRQTQNSVNLRFTHSEIKKKNIQTNSAAFDKKKKKEQIKPCLICFTFRRGDPKLLHVWYFSVGCF